MPTPHNCSYCSCSLSLSIHLLGVVSMLKEAKSIAAVAILEVVILNIIKKGFFFLLYRFFFQFGVPGSFKLVSSVTLGFLTLGFLTLGFLTLRLYCTLPYQVTDSFLVMLYLAENMVIPLFLFAKQVRVN